MVEPGHSYMVTVFNLPEPEIERDQVRIRKQIIIPGELPPDPDVGISLVGIL